MVELINSKTIIMTFVVAIMLWPLAKIYSWIGIGETKAQSIVIVFTLCVILMSLSSENGQPGASVRFYGACAASFGLVVGVLVLWCGDPLPHHGLLLVTAFLIVAGATTLCVQILDAPMRGPAALSTLAVFGTVLGILGAPVLTAFTMRLL